MANAQIAALSGGAGDDQLFGDLIRAEQAGADVRISLVWGNIGEPAVTEVIVRSVGLAGLPDGWISR